METELPELGGGGAPPSAGRRLVIGWVAPARLDAETLARIAVAAAAVGAAGLRARLPDRDAEVAQGFLDRLPEGVFLELDAGWAWYAGASRWPSSGAGRWVHVKDFAGCAATRSFCPVGDGAVGYERDRPGAAQDGAEWLMVEQDERSDHRARRRHAARLPRLTSHAHGGRVRVGVVGCGVISRRVRRECQRVRLVRDGGLRRSWTRPRPRRSARRSGLEVATRRRADRATPRSTSILNLTPPRGAHGSHARRRSPRQARVHREAARDRLGRGPRRWSTRPSGSGCASAARPTSPSAALPGGRGR